jgi:hypothetical protein
MSFIALTIVQEDDVLLCECGVTVHVGLGGQANLETHKKSQAHHLALEAKKYSPVTNLFVARSKLPKSVAPVPALLQNSHHEGCLALIPSPSISDPQRDKCAPLPPSSSHCGSLLLKLLVHCGALGMDGFCLWVETLLVEDGIVEALLVEKLSHLIEAMKEL